MADSKEVAQSTDISLTRTVAFILALGGRYGFSSVTRDYHQGFYALLQEDPNNLLGGLSFNRCGDFPYSSRLEEIMGTHAHTRVICRSHGGYFDVGNEEERADVFEMLHREHPEIEADILRLAKRFAELVPATGERPLGLYGKIIPTHP